MKRKDGELGEGDEFDAYKGLIAGSSSESDEASAEGSEAEEREQKRIEDMRQKLLGDLQDDEGGPKKGKLEDEEAESQSDELEVNWGVGFGEDIGKNLLEKKREK